MAMSTVVKQPRRTQEQRSTEMRVRLLDATVDCLVEYGYAGTTTPRVAERAGVTRGAQAHHFGSKADLVVAAVGHLARRRAETLMREVSRVETAADPVATALDFLWELHQGPLFVATIELFVAGRTEPMLAEAMTKLEPLVDDAVLLAVARLTPEGVNVKVARDFVHTAMDALRGILISNFIDPDIDCARRRWARASAHLREIGNGVLDAHRRE
ncbi:TetR/AcrR family transcriptional regulator [Nocardia sp. CNY236]|uniref:TetR/AcrR family transcriptional regulator n=1 Tax=Nocardia sp. CNY236 TaxID=1169152 RepID=UPI00055F4788|nr:TetR/AcrR family transcriptional regulator [Nocardia sp. CNY236]